MGFRLFTDTVEMPCKLSNKTLYLGNPSYYKKYELTWLKFNGLEFDWQQNIIDSSNGYLRGKLLNKTFEIIIDCDMEITIIHRKTNLIIANYKPAREINDFCSSYDQTHDFLDKRIGSYIMELSLGFGTRQEQLILESKAECFDNVYKSKAADIIKDNQTQDYSFLLVPSDYIKAQTCFIMKTKDTDKMYKLSCNISPNDRILPLYRTFINKSGKMYLQYENSDYLFEILECITNNYGRRLLT